MGSDEKNRALAKAMGATNFREITLYSLAGTVQKTICDPPPGTEPNLRVFECKVTKRPAFSTHEPPAFDSDASASRELVLWLDGDDKRWDAFEIEMAMLVTDGQGYFKKNPMRALWTAPLDVIRDAAFAAIGGKSEDV